MSKGGQNTSAAVMQQRHAGRDEYDYYPTPPWGTRALCYYLKTRYYDGTNEDLATMTVWEPACGEGFMFRPLSEYFGKVVATDIQDFSASFAEQDGVSDFLLGWGDDRAGQTYDWIITNPPFVLGQEFIEASLKIATKGVAMLVRIAFLETIDRYNELLKPYPPTFILQFVERLPMEKGRVRKEASSATAYCWLIWSCDKSAMTNMGTLFHWIPPGTRKQFEKQSDYPDWAKEVAPMPLFDGAGV